MYKTIPYIVLFVLTLLLQVYFFNNLTVSVYLNPLIYICVLMLLPIEMPSVAVLFVGLTIGVLTDFAMGVVGINTATTVFLAFVRPQIFRLLCDKETIREGGIPSRQKLGGGIFFQYITIAVLIHHILFFILDDLSFTHLPFTLIRTLVSSLFSVICIWMLAQLFTPKLRIKS